MHLQVNILADYFDKVMPNTFGLSWRIALGSFTSAYGHVQTYVQQLESVEAWW